VLAEEHLDVGPGQFGLLIAAIGVGAGFGPLVVHRFVDDVRRPRFLYGPYLLRGVVDLVPAASSRLPVTLGALTVYGVGTSTGNVTYSSVLQTTVPDRIRGRVFAFYDVVWQSCRLASIGIGGVVADRLGITAVYGLGAPSSSPAAAFGFLAGYTPCGGQPSSLRRGRSGHRRRPAARGWPCGKGGGTRVSRPGPVRDASAGSGPAGRRGCGASGRGRRPRSPQRRWWPADLSQLRARRPTGRPSLALHALRAWAAAEAS